MSANQSAWNSKYNQGLFNPINPSKYLGDPTQIKYRSSWELAFARYLDNTPDILRWSCEQPVILYQDLRNKSHRYYPDFYYEIMVDNDPNKHMRVIVEIKPNSELFPPQKPKNQTGKALENYEYAVRTHVKNKLKWNAADDFAKKHGMSFVIITETILKSKGLIKS